MVQKAHRIRKLIGAVLIVGRVAAAETAAAQEVHGRIELQDVGAFENSCSLDSLLGYRDRNDILGDLRLIWEPRWDHWDFGFAYELSADSGDSVALADRRASLGIWPVAPANNWWNLSNTFLDYSRLTATQHIDRLWLGYSDSHLVIRLGRQALTWGSGLVFRPMDLFNPFAPNATDVEYKLGTDMAYGQWLFDDGSDLQVVVAPRPRKIGGALTSNTSSYALHFHTSIGPLQTTWLVARDRGDWVAGVGANGALGEATWNAEIIPTVVGRTPTTLSQLFNSSDVVATFDRDIAPWNGNILPTIMQNGATLVSGILNISDATTVYAHDVTLFSEYYRNGFGLSERRYAIIDLPAPLFERLVRGQVFDTGRDYLALGAILQCTPLLQVNPTLIANLDDGGFFGVVQATYSLKENLNLIVGGQIAIAPPNTEFGGLPLVEHVPIYIEQPKEVYVQLRQYF